VVAFNTSELYEVLPAAVEVMVNSIPQGAAIMVDGKNRGSTPVKFSLLPGSYIFHFSLSGYYDVEQSVTLNEPGKSMTVRMEPEVVFEMVRVEADTFQMGCGDNAEGVVTNKGCAEAENSEKPVHAVSLNSFYIGKYEVTQQQWMDVMGSNPSRLTNCDKCPVESVSFKDIQEFLQKLNSKSSKKYRLPTEAEWEYAARGGHKIQEFAYSGSNKAEEVAWFSLNSGNKTHPVGEKTPNSLGIYDMSGNVWEWCSDFYDETFYGRSPVNNPKGPPSGDFNILRGGSWLGPSSKCRVSSRKWEMPNQKSDSHGFRLVTNE
jgi:formylglycine-generating enzyme required for sulfatase activity